MGKRESLYQEDHDFVLSWDLRNSPDADRCVIVLILPRYNFVASSKWSPILSVSSVFSSWATCPGWRSGGWMDGLNFLSDTTFTSQPSALVPLIAIFKCCNINILSELHCCKNILHLWSWAHSSDLRSWYSVIFIRTWLIRKPSVPQFSNLNVSEFLLF